MKQSLLFLALITVGTCWAPQDPTLPETIQRADIYGMEDGEYIFKIYEYPCPPAFAAKRRLWVSNHRGTSIPEQRAILASLQAQSAKRN